MVKFHCHLCHRATKIGREEGCSTGRFQRAFVGCKVQLQYFADRVSQMLKFEMSLWSPPLYPTGLFGAPIGPVRNSGETAVAVPRS